MCKEGKRERGKMGKEEQDKSKKQKVFYFFY
jgi:hypothetical protein